MAKKNKSSKDWSYSGFSRPEANFFRMPNDWPNITANITSLAELKVVEYVLRHTWGFSEYDEPKRITTDEFMNGRKGRSGSRLDQGTGLSNRSVIDGLRRAVAHGLLIEIVDDQDKARIKKSYKLNMRPGEGPNSDVKKVHTGVNNLHSKGGESSQRSEKETTERNINVVVKELTDRKIAPKKATDLAKQYSAEHIEQKIEWVDALVEMESPLVSKNPAGYLIKAIEENYQAPRWFKTKAEIVEEQAEEQRIREETQASIDKEAQREREFKKRIIASYGIPNGLVETWDVVLDQLRLQREYQQLYIQLQGSFLLSVEDNVALIGVLDKDKKEWLNARAQSTLAHVLNGVFGKSMSVVFKVLEKQDL